MFGNMDTLNQEVGKTKYCHQHCIKEEKLLRVTDINDGKSVWTKELFPESENTFYLNYENVQYEFVKKGNKVGALNIYENGKLIEEAKRK
jgi:hypothetical protein